jgi:release factor glutamine methyltransferase
VLLKDFKIYFERELSDLFNLAEVRHFFYILIEDLLNENRFLLAVNPDYTLSAHHLNTFENALKGLKKKAPIQYITGLAHFGNLTLKVNESVLIPTILDIGSGSGCIPIALSQAFPHASITAIDVSEKALAVARENANKYKSTINWELKNILSEKSLDQKYDLIVSNPPYVRALEKVEMSKNVLAYEPELALFVTDKDPLIFYKKISELAFDFLSQDGLLFFEINEYLGEETTALIKNIGFKKIVLKQDMYLKNRMIMAKAIA